MRWPRSERAIRNIITAIHASKGNGQTLEERCRGKGISLSTYNRWRRWLREDDVRPITLVGQDPRDRAVLNYLRNLRKQLESDNAR